MAANHLVASAVTAVNVTIDKAVGSVEGVDIGSCDMASGIYSVSISPFMLHAYNLLCYLRDFSTVVVLSLGVIWYGAFGLCLLCEWMSDGDSPSKAIREDLERYLRIWKNKYVLAVFCISAIICLAIPHDNGLFMSMMIDMISSAGISSK